MYTSNYHKNFKNICNNITEIKNIFKPDAHENLIKELDKYVNNFVACYDNANVNKKEYTFFNVLIKDEDIDSLLQNKKDNEQTVIRSLIENYNKIIHKICKLLKQIEKAEKPEDIKNILLGITNNGIDHNVIKYAFNTICRAISKKAEDILTNYSQKNESYKKLIADFDATKDKEIIQLMDDTKISSSNNENSNNKKYNYGQLLLNAKTCFCNYKIKIHNNTINPIIIDKNSTKLISNDNIKHLQEKQTNNKVNYIEQYKDVEGRTILYYLDECFKYEYATGTYDNFMERLKILAGTEENLIELCNQRDVYGLTPLEYLLVNHKNNNSNHAVRESWNKAVDELFKLSKTINKESIKNNIKEYLKLKGEYNEEEYSKICCSAIENKCCNTSNIINTKPQSFNKTTKTSKTRKGILDVNDSKKFEFCGGKYSEIIINGKTFCKSNFAENDTIMKQQLQQIKGMIDGGIIKQKNSNGVPTLTCPFLNINFDENKTLKIDINYNMFENIELKNIGNIKDKKQKVQEFLKYYFENFKNIDNFSIDKDGNKKYYNNKNFKNVNNLGNEYKRSYELIKEKAIDYLEANEKAFYGVIMDYLGSNEVCGEFLASEEDSSKDNYKYLYRYVLKDCIDNITVDNCFKNIINGRSIICQCREAKMYDETRKYIVNNYLNRLLISNEKIEENNLKTKLSNTRIFSTNKKLTSKFIELYNNIQELRSNVQNNKNARDFANLVDNIKSGLKNIKSKSGFDILSLYENSNIVDFINNIKVEDNNQTIGSLILSKQKSSIDKEFIKAKRKEIILNSDALTSSKAINVYNSDAKGYKEVRKNSDQLGARLLGSTKEFDNFFGNEQNTCVFVNNN